MASWRRSENRGHREEPPRGSLTVSGVSVNLHIPVAKTHTTTRAQHDGGSQETSTRGGRASFWSWAAGGATAAAWSASSSGDDPLAAGAAASGTTAAAWAVTTRTVAARSRPSWRQRHERRLGRRVSARAPAWRERSRTGRSSATPVAGGSVSRAEQKLSPSHATTQCGGRARCSRRRRRTEEVGFAHHAWPPCPCRHPPMTTLAASD